MSDSQSDILAICHLLLDHGICTEEQLEETREEHERTGTPFIQAIFNTGYLTELEFLELVAENMGTQVVSVKEYDPDPDLIQSIRPDVIRMYGIFPLWEEDNRVTVAAIEPMNYRLIDELGYVLGKSIDIVVARPEEILAAIDHFYPESVDSMDDVLNSLENLDLGDLEEDNITDIASQEQVANSTPIVRFVNVILYQAVKDQASDIHFEPFREEFKIRYRIDGALYEMAPPPRHLAVPVISRLKVISGLNIAERKLPQDGRIELRVAGKKIDLRVSSLPTRYGESVVLRILDKGVVNLDIDALGMPDDIKVRLRLSIRKPNGIILVTGPTGSGKTTTLYSCLNEINNIEDKILTAEDPVEYDIEGLIQVPVNEGIGMTFAKALKAFLRQDPDRIMLGEIRDLVTATIGIEAALTGHLVLSTLHTNDAPSAVTRLINMGVEPFLITSALECVIAQRLVRRICVGCKKYYTPPDEELESLELTIDDLGENQFAYGEGCVECNNTGYKGRKGIYELFVMSQEIRKMVARREPSINLATKAKEEGMRSLREDGIRSIFTGETTVEEVLKYT